MAEVQPAIQRRTTGGELGSRERRKSGIFFFNRSFKKNLAPFAEVEHIDIPTRHRLKKIRPIPRSRVEEEHDTRPRARRQVSLPLASNPPFPKRMSSSSSRSSSYNKGDAENAGSSPTTPTLGPAKDIELKRTASGHSIPALAESAIITAETGGNTEANANEDLPTPPQTPGHSTQDAASHEVTNEEGEVEETAEAVEAPQEAEPVLPEVKRVSYHEESDLEVKVQEAEGVDAVYSVRSSAMANASPIWKQNISTQPSSLELTSDPAPGLDVLFNIAHYKFQDVPQQVEESQIHDIALVAGKYQTLHLLVPFLSGWLSSVGKPTATAEKSLVTGWILGQAQWFSQAISQSANSASVSTEGTLLDSEGRPWSEQPVSSEVVELISATRTSAIERIIKAVSNPMNRLLNPELYPEEEISYCHAPEEDAAVREECEQLQLGSAIMGLTKARLWPAPEVSRIRASPIELAKAYKDVRIRRYQTPGLRFQEEEVKDAHAECGFGHNGEIESILSEPIILPAGIVKDLQARASKCGTYRGAVYEGFFEGLVVEVDSPQEPTIEDSVEPEQSASTETVVLENDVKEDNCEFPPLSGSNQREY